ncbi:MAG: 3'-5' exonuclease [Pseudomonadota bacterium]
MAERLGLRIRVFLLFALLAGGAAALAAGALAFGWSRAGPEAASDPFVTAFLLFAFLNTGLIVGIWLLFDENVAKPINKLSAKLRLRALSGESAEIGAGDAPYLGDLAPAAGALSENAQSSLEDTARRVARETEKLTSESERLTALLTEIPIATILLNPAREIVLYDGQAAEVLSAIGTPRLKAPIHDYFDPESLDEAIAALSDEVSEVPLELKAETTSLKARLKALGADGHLIFIDTPPEPTAAIEARPLVFDFDLMNTTAAPLAMQDRHLRDLCFVVVDLETTGLSVKDDAIIQMAAVRIVGGEIVPGEEFATYVDPGRPIPPASTRIHKISDRDVEGAPKIWEAGRRLHHFARDAVFVAHNAPFDLGLLKRHEAEIGACWDHPVLDTVLLSAVAFGTTEDHSLDGLCDRLAITIPPQDRHSALGDAKATAHAFVKLLQIIDARGLSDFARLQPEIDRQARRFYNSAETVTG